MATNIASSHLRLSRLTSVWVGFDEGDGEGEGNEGLGTDKYDEFNDDDDEEEEAE